MVHGQAVPQGPSQCGWLEDAEVVADDRYVEHVKKRPDQIGNKDRPGPAAQIVFIAEWLRQRLAVKHAERRKKEKCRHRKAGKDFQERNQSQVGRRIDDGDGADMNGNDTEHAKTPHIINGMNKTF